MPITDAMTAAYKRDLMFGRHHHAQTRTFTASATSGSQTLTSVSALTGLAVGMFLANASFQAGTRITDILSANSIGISKTTTGALSASTVTALGDTFKIALFKGTSTTGTYGASTTSYADMTGNSDETNGTGYTAGGQTLTNVDPVASGSGAYTNFSPNPSWTAASFSTTGAMIYNASQNGDVTNPACSVYSFGGNQQVTNGTFTAVMPTAGVGTAILYIS